MEVREAPKDNQGVLLAPLPTRQKKTEERIEIRREELVVKKKVNDEYDEQARQAANIFFATRSYEEVKKHLGLHSNVWRRQVASILAKPAALKELERLREDMRRRSMITREDAALFLMRVLELEPSKYMATRTEQDRSGMEYEVKFMDFAKMARDGVSRYIDKVDWDGTGVCKGSFISKMDAFKRLCELQGWDAARKVEFSQREVDPRIMSMEKLMELRDAAVREAAMQLVQPVINGEENGPDSESRLRDIPAEAGPHEAGV